MKKNDVLFRFMKFGFHLMSERVSSIQFVLWDSNGECFVYDYECMPLIDFYNLVNDFSSTYDRISISYRLSDFRYRKVIDIVNTERYSNYDAWCSIVKPLIFD